MVDAPPTVGTKLVAAIREVTSRPVRYFVYSHAQADHVGSAHLFPDATQYGHTETAKLLRRERDRKRPAPTRAFTR